ncbi:uncharacterized protein LOC126883768 [Diabrotica virgifera virgifera]|uniref:DNA-directed DNA polymerase n=1 Tax=Diabrotica virgifera virgifera TaxID=50390 RepID=A0ABM5K5C4_DIAVI|nr:uncharacterized protein LOC126883768 [Diabrotica virgifera virgifera]
MNTCSRCDKSYSRSDSLSRHIKKCKYGNVDSDKNGDYYIPKKRLRPLGVEVIDSTVSKLSHAFKNRIASYRFNSGKKLDYHGFLNDVKPKVLNILSEYLHQHNIIKVNFEIFGIYLKPDTNLSDIKSMNTCNKIITISTELDEVFDHFKEELMTQASEFQEKDSNWLLQEIMFLDVNINKYSSISASTYIRLPIPIVRKHAILNIENKDNKCFAWSIIAAIFPASGNPTKPESYPPYDALLNFEGIDFPMKLKDIKKFETLNNISVNVYGLESNFVNNKRQYEIVGPLYFTSNRHATHVNLLLITNDKQSHYCLILDMLRLVKSQKTSNHRKEYLCDGCLQFFVCEEKLHNHQNNDCSHIYTELPTTKPKINKFGEMVPENILKFINIQKMLPVPFVIYADFESLLKPIDHVEPCNGNSYSVKTAEHQAYSFAFYLKCNYDDSLSKLIKYEGQDAPKVFIQKLDDLVHELYNNHLKHIKPMSPLTKEEIEKHESATECYLCGKPFNPFNRKVKDHHHLNSLYLGPSHNSCNINNKLSNTIPVFFHNMSNYDCHLFIKELSTTGEKVSVIAQTKEKYITISKGILVEKSKNGLDKYITLKFVDSYRFLAKSLDILSTTLNSEQCTEIRKYFPNTKHFELVRHKGVFPYSYMDGFDRLKEKTLPPKENFYNNLTNKHISDEDYARAIDVWNTFDCKSMSDYAMVYLVSDVLLLADVFENFRKICHKEYNLDPCHYITAPALSWDAMLRYTEIELELLTDVDMVHFLKKGVRGGVAQCSKREAVANNQYVPNYDPQQPESYIMYLDATNLYGAAMCQYLPYGNFKWVTDVENFNCFSVEDDGDKGYVLEVDLEYPAHLHSLHNDLPFCPESMVPPGSKFPKLIPNFNNKTKYIIHYRNLKQCLRYGLVLKRIHRILEFSQSPWLKKYIDLNTSLRNKAKNEFERDLFKLLVNAIFGKTLENVEKRRDIRLCTRWETKTSSLGARVLISKPEFKSCSVFNENLVAIHLGKTKIVYDKPLYVGFTILDLSKTVIYDFYYGYIKKKYGEAANLLYTDTDSLIMEIFTPNFYEDMKRNLEHFDTSNYPTDNIHRIPKTPSILGKMKDEFASVPIQCFYGTGAKAYCIEANTIIKKAKGISKHVTKTQLQKSDYVLLVKKGGVIFRKMYVFVSNLHTIYTELRNKVALSSKDDKRCVINGDVKTLAWGHFLISPHNGTIDDLIRFGNELLHTPELVDLENIPLEELFQVDSFQYDSYL